MPLRSQPETRDPYRSKEQSKCLFYDLTLSKAASDRLPFCPFCFEPRAVASLLDARGIWCRIGKRQMTCQWACVSGRPRRHFSPREQRQESLPHSERFRERARAFRMRRAPSLSAMSYLLRSPRYRHGVPYLSRSPLSGHGKAATPRGGRDRRSCRRAVSTQ
jgi:hypothetical protein